MPGVGFNTWWPKQCDTVFKVRNICANGKTVRIFNYPIPVGLVRDLMEIPEVSEADIRHSLLKGTLMIKIITEEIEVVESNIDLIQFDQCQKSFLSNAGVTSGLEASSTGTGVNYLWKEGAELIGIKNGANRIFTLPDQFLEGTFEDNEFHINVFHNGRRLIRFVDYLAIESGGTGTGFDTVKIISFAPDVKSKLVANYVIERT